MKHYVMALVCLMSMGLVTAQAAGVYKWVDEKGGVHFGDIPGSSSASTVKVAPPPPPDASLLKRQEQGKKILQAGQDDRKAEEKKQAEAKVKEEENDAKCADLRARLKNYEEARYLYLTDKDGKQVIITDEQRKQSTAETKQAIEDSCK